MLYPQNGDRILTIDSVTTLHPVYSPRFGIAYQFRPTTHARQYAGHPGAFLIALEEIVSKNVTCSLQFSISTALLSVQFTLMKTKT